MASRMYHFETMRSARALVVLAAFACLLIVVALPVLINIGTVASLAAAAVLIVAAVALVGSAAGHAHAAGVVWEYGIRRVFRDVARRRNLIKKDPDGREHFPRLVRLIGRPDAWVGTVRPVPGQSLGEWQKTGDAFSLAYGSIGVRFHDNGDGTLLMRAGYAPLESCTAVVPEGDSDADGGQSWRQRLSAIGVAVTEGGRPFCLPAIDTHILIAGITGAGKGSVIWSLLLGLVPGIQANVVRAWGVDPKRLELQLGRAFFGDRYANTVDGMLELLDRAVAEMMECGDRLAAAGVRRFEPTPETPLNVIVIDELAYLSSFLTDRKQKDRAEKALQTLLALGRALGFVVVGALQDPRVENLKFRELFPRRVCMKVAAGMVDLVLGPGAREAGALCDLIPDPETGGAGVAFVLAEGTTTPVPVRFTWCPDDLIVSTARRLDAPPASPLIAA